MAKLLLPATFRRALIAGSFSLLFLTMKDIMPPLLHWGSVIVICAVFVKLPDIRGIRSGVVAAFFSLIFAGLGHLYIREYGRAFFFILGGSFAFMISDYAPQYVLFNMVLLIASAVDSFSFGKRGIGIF